MTSKAYAAYLEVVRSARPNVKLFKPGSLKRAVEFVQEGVGTPQESSAMQLTIPERLDGDTLVTYSCLVYIVAPDPDEQVALIDELETKLTRNQGAVHNRFDARTRNLDGLAYAVTAVTFRLKI